jgi:hypothetical protein
VGILLLELVDEEGSFMLATTNDPRVTTVGKYLRSLRIDEIPQLINVLIMGPDSCSAVTPMERNLRILNSRPSLVMRVWR